MKFPTRNDTFSILMLPPHKWNINGSQRFIITYETFFYFPHLWPYHVATLFISTCHTNCPKSTSRIKLLTKAFSHSNHSILVFHIILRSNHCVSFSRLKLSIHILTKSLSIRGCPRPHKRIHLSIKGFHNTTINNLKSLEGIKLRFDDITFNNYTKPT